MKYYLKETKKEVKFGDVIEITSKEKTDYGESTVTIKTVLSPDNVNIFLKEGVIYNKWERVNNYLYEAKKAIAKKIDLTYYETEIFLAFLEKYFPHAAVEIYLKEISNLMASPECLKDLDRVYIISLINGKVYSVKTEDVTSFDNFAAFHSKEYAEYARYILKHLLKRMFKNEQENH